LRLAIITSHPVQYNGPWFRWLAERGTGPGSALPIPDAPISIRVFYLWDGGANERFDPGFAMRFKWDIPLLDGYACEFVPNRARRPGPGHILGLDNPRLADRVEAFEPDAVLLFGYNYLAHYRFIFSRVGGSVPLLLRGDSRLRGEAEIAERRRERGAAGRALLSRLSARPFLRRLWISLVFRRFAAFLYVGRANRDYFTYHGVPEHKLFFSPHAVDKDRFFGQAAEARLQAAAWRQELGIPGSHRVVLFAGKFEPKKRPADLMAAFEQAQLKDATLLFVGGGELEGELRGKAERLKTEMLKTESRGAAQIVFAPFQNQTQMPRTYAAADLFVLPSVGREETWGLAVNEAMCMARPIIVSDNVGCAQDLVHPGRNGLVFPAGDVPALADALREAFSDPERLRSWGAASREIVQDYTYEQATKGLAQALEGVKRGR